MRNKPLALLRGLVLVISICIVLPSILVQINNSTGNSNFEEQKNIIKINNQDSLTPKYILDPPYLISPEDNAFLSTTTPTLDWDSVMMADFYELQVSQSDTFDPLDFTTETASFETQWQTSPLSNGHYYWRVRAYDNSYNPGDWSEVWEFTLDTIPPNAPILFSLANNSVINYNNVTFMWNGCSDSSNYEILIDDDKSFSSSISVSVDTEFLAYTLSDATWYWKVRAYDLAENEGDWSDIWMLTIDTMSPDAPVLIVPITGSILNGMNLYFEWTTVAEAVLYEILESPSLDYSINHTYTSTQTFKTLTTQYWDSTYYFRVRAKDAAGNWGEESNVVEITTDCTSPTVTDVTTNPETVNDAEEVFILCNVTDAHGIGEVLLFYRLNGGSWSSIEMINTFDDQYEVSLGHYSIDDVVEYYIQAEDDLNIPNVKTEDNGGSYYSFTIGISDSQGPTITSINYLPINPVDGESVSINCSITDRNGVDSVILSYRMNSATWVNVTMTNIEADIYNAEIGPFDFDDTIEFFIIATDGYILHNVAINDNSGSYYNFTMGPSDVTGPTIYNIIFSPFSPTDADYITISCNVTDVNGVFEVILSYRINGGVWINISMIHDSGEKYVQTIGLFDYGDIIEFFITAIDDYVEQNTSFNDNSGSYFLIIIGSSDFIGPTIEDIAHTPTLPTDADSVIITCSATDTHGILFVSLYYRVNGDIWQVVNMTLTTGSTYSFTIGVFNYADEVDYYFFAMDNSPNHNTIIVNNLGVYYSFTVISSDTTSPIIENITHSEVVAGALVNVSCIVIDVSGIQSVTLHIRLNNGTWMSVNMILQNGNTFMTSIGPFAIGNFVHYYVSAIDNSPNHNSAINDNDGAYYFFNIKQTTTPTEEGDIPIPIIVFAIISTMVIIVGKRNRK